MAAPDENAHKARRAVRERRMETLLMSVPFARCIASLSFKINIVVIKF
jgi:hypothetical protein